jgi:hypothetical protein
MRMRLAVCLAVAVCLVGAVCCAGAAAPREDGDGVLQLDSDTFADAIERQTAPALVRRGRRVLRHLRRNSSVPALLLTAA